MLPIKKTYTEYPITEPLIIFLTCKTVPKHYSMNWQVFVRKYSEDYRHYEEMLLNSNALTQPGAPSIVMAVKNINLLSNR